VVVNPAFAPNGAPLPTNMDTEREVVLSQAVASIAADKTGTSPGQLQRGLSVSVPAGTTVFVLRYEDRTPGAARRNAQAIADAYAFYRAGQAAVLSRATEPRSTTAPPYLLDAAVALVLGLLVGIGSAVVRDRRDDRLRGPDDFSRQTDLPVLATVAAEPGENDLAVVDRPGSPEAEAYRQLRGKVCRAARGRDGTATITLVTSAAGEAGAARVAANLAAALAVGGSRVLLVDADLRSATGDHAGDDRSAPGLAEVLAGHAPLGEAVSAGPVDRLLLVRAGSGSLPPSGDLLDEAGVNRLLGQLPADFDHVVLAAPAGLHAAETSTMAEHADQVVVVASTEATRRRDLRTAVTELRSDGATVVGGVLEIPLHGSGQPGRAGAAGKTADVPRPTAAEAGGHRAVERLAAGRSGADVVTARDE
jgi:succinoglycan biosynthesis transport protein ExoP